MTGDIEITEGGEMAKCTEVRKDQKAEFKRFVPTPECAKKAFQMDDFGNFRIVVKGKEGDWVGYERVAMLDVDGEKFIGVSKYFDGYLPTECVMKVEVVDEDGEPNFFKFKVVNTVEDRILDHEEVDEILRDPPFDDEDYIYTVKESSQKDFVKIKMMQYGNCVNEGKYLTKEEIIDIIIDIFSTDEYDVYDEDGNIINT